MVLYAIHKGLLIISKPLTNLLIKDVELNVERTCLNVFDRLKEALTSALIMQSPD